MTSDCITLVPHNAMLSFADTFPSGTALTSRRLYMDVRVTCGDVVRMPTQNGRLQIRTLKDAYWTVEFVDTDVYNEYATEQGFIGFLRTESCHVSAALKRENFAMLLSALQHGHLPEKICVWVKGLTYGWEYDGTDVVWDVEAESDVPIVEVSFNLPLVATTKSKSS